MQLIAKEKPLYELLGDQYLYYINNRVNYHEALTQSKLRDEAVENFAPRVGFGPHGPGFGAHRPGLETQGIFRHKPGCPLYRAEEDAELKVIEV